MTRDVVRIATPLIVWAMHFIAMYALISAACAPRALLTPEALRAVGALLTAFAAIAVLVVLFMAGRATRRAEQPALDAPLSQAAWWCALISLLAVLINVAPLALLTSCSG